MIKLSRKWSGWILLVSVVIALTLAGACAPGTAQPRGWSGVVPVDNTIFFGSRQGKLVEIDLATRAQKWSASVSTGSPGGGGFGCSAPSPTVAIYGTPAVNGDMIYAGGYIQQGNISNGKIFAFVVGQSEPRWVYPRDGFLNGPVVGGLVVAQGKVYFGDSDGKVYALDAVDGHKIAEFQTGDKVWSTPVVVDNTVYIGSFDKKLYALDANTLEPVKWRSFETQGAIDAPPVIDNNTIYFGSFDRYLYAIDAGSGQLKWKYLTGNWLWARPVFYNGAIYAPGLDGKVYIVDAATGNELAAAVDLSSPISSSPVLVGSRVIVVNEQGKVYSISSENKQASALGDVQQVVYAPLSANDNTVFIHTDQDALFTVDVNTGAVSQLLF